jgi:mRNA-degrading endonuclease toxin of MazEF toxin-antitoxin module
MKVVAADVTTTARDRAFPTAVEVEPSTENGLNDISYVVCHELTTYRRARLDAAPIGRLSPADMWKVEEAILMVIGAKDLPN